MGSVVQARTQRLSVDGLPETAAQILKAQVVYQCVCTCVSRRQVQGFCWEQVYLFALRRQKHQL